MSDPERWVDAPEVSAELKSALRGATRARSLDASTRARVGVRLGRASAVPISALTWLSLKSAAALGLAGGATVASVLAVAERYSHDPSTLAAPRAAPSHSRAAPAPRASEAASTPRSLPSPPEPLPTAAIPTLNPPSDLPRVPNVASASPLPSASARATANLAEESALLEQARRALVSTPNAALSLVRAHELRFPNGQLSAERRLLEVDALYHLGRGGEARALAERLLAQGGDDLYVGRLQRLLAKMRGER